MPVGTEKLVEPLALGHQEMGTSVGGVERLGATASSVLLRDRAGLPTLVPLLRVDRDLVTTFRI